MLLTEVADLYPHLDEKQRSTLVQILVKQIIVDSTGEIVDYQLNSPFVYLRSLVDNLSTPSNGEGGSEHIREGTPSKIHPEPQSLVVEKFLLMLRLEYRGKLAELSLIRSEVGMFVFNSGVLFFL